MRSLFSFILACSLALKLAAVDQVFAVSPKNLDGWTLTGADLAALEFQEQLTLPKGSQLSRDFPGQAVVAHVVSRPVFTEDSSDWPILAVGSAALALIKQGDQGRMVLVVDDRKVIDLPWNLSLKGKDESVELILACDPVSGTGLIGFQGEAKSFSLPLSAKPVETWFSAGGTSPWRFDTLEVVVLSADETEGGSTGQGTGATRPSPADKLNKVAEQLLSTGAGTTTAGAGPSTGLSKLVGSLDAPAASTLEVFTPSSVRRTKVIDSVRSAAAKRQRK